MIYVKVESSNIREVGWENECLFVRFHHGGEYRYQGVSHEIYTQMLTAPSVGKFFSSEVKAKYPYEKTVTT